MVTVLAALVTGLLALVPAVVLSGRRRMLRLLKEENEVYGALEDAALKAKLKEALGVSTEAYRARVLGLDRVQRARRDALVVVVVGAAVLLLDGIAVAATARKDSLLGLPLVPGRFVSYGVEVLVVLVAAGAIVRFRLAQRARGANRQKALEVYERDQLVEDVRSGRVSEAEWDRMIDRIAKKHPRDSRIGRAAAAEIADREKREP